MIVNKYRLLFVDRTERVAHIPHHYILREGSFRSRNTLSLRKLLLKTIKYEAILTLGLLYFGVKLR
jgi:hypothetical protein